MLAISADGIASHERFAGKLGDLPFPLLSDIERRVIQLYGVLNERGTGARRSLFVVGKDGIIRHANHKYELSNPAQYEAVFRALEGLRGG